MSRGPSRGLRLFARRAFRPLGAHRVFSLLLTPAIVAALACGALRLGTTDAAAQERFGVHGSDTIGAELMPALIEGFAQTVGYSVVREPSNDAARETLRALFGVDPAFEIDLRRAGSSASFQAIAAGVAEIAMSSRPIRDEEAETIAAAAGVDMREPGSEHVIALDGIVVIVSPENPLPAISIETAARIFAGDIRDWGELGLPPGAIQVHARDEGSGTWDIFKSLVLTPSDLELSANAARYASSEQLARAVAQDPLGIGFAPLAFAETARTVPIALECGMVVQPDSFAIKAGEYPLRRSLYLYTVGQPASAEAGRIVDFAASEEAQPIIAEAGFVDQSIELQDSVTYSNHIIGAMQAVQSDAERAALRDLIQIANVKRRLSVTFRFEPGGVLLDAKSVSDAGRLARWMVRPENANYRVTLIGFADSIGGYQANLPLSLERANAVRRAVLIQAGPALDPGRIELYGFSTVAPIACNSTARGRAANRRVEVWIGR